MDGRTPSPGRLSHGGSMFRAILFTTSALAVMALPTMALAQQPLRLGSDVTGTLRPGDDRLDSGEYRDLYEFEGRAGQQIGLRLSSDDFDPYLMVRGPGDFSEDNDDASEADRNALLNLRLPADGTYRITATSYESGERGTYHLSLIGGRRAADRPDARAAGTGGPDPVQRGIRRSLHPAGAARPDL